MSERNEYEVLQPGDLVAIKVDWPDRVKCRASDQLLDKGTYRVIKIRESVASQNLPRRYKMSAVLVKEAKTGRRYKYQHSINMSYFQDLLKRGELELLEPVYKVVDPG